MKYRLLLIILSMMALNAMKQPQKLQEPVNTQITPTQALEVKKKATNNAETASLALFSPVDSTTKPPTPNPYATTSLNETAIDATFGAQGLNLPANYIQYIKNFYFYLEYVVRLEYAAKLAALASSKNIDFLGTIDNGGWKAFVQKMESAAGSWQALEQQLQAMSTLAVQDIIGTIHATSWQNLVETDFWQSFENRITAQSIINSTVWQNHLKITICNTLNQDTGLLTSVFESEVTIFKYIPNIEVAYYHPEFTVLRNGSEMFRISLVLTDALRNRLIAQSLDWKGLDPLKQLSAAQDFQQTDFYKVATIAEQDPTNAMNQIAQSKFPYDINVFKKVPFLQEQLTCLAMIKSLQALTMNLYDNAHLNGTMQVLVNSKIVKPSPTFLIYTPDDYLYLDDLAHLNDKFVEHANNQQTTTPAQATKLAKYFMSKKPEERVVVSSFFGSMWNTAKDTAGNAWNDVKKGVTDTEKLGSDTLDTITNEAEALGFTSLGAFLKVTGLDPKMADKLLKESRDLQNKVYNDLQAAGDDLDTLVDDVGTTAEDVNNGIGAAIGQSLSLLDPKLGKAAQGFYVSIFDTFVQSAENLQHITIQDGLGILKLNVDAINMLADITADAVTGDYKDLGTDILSGLTRMAKDTAVTLLNILTITAKNFINNLMNLIKVTAYLTAMLTRVWIDMWTAVTFLATGFAAIFDPSIDPYAISQDVQNTLSEHERTINAVITTALLLASIPLTGGSSLAIVGMGAMTLGPQLFSVYGSYQEDEMAKEQLETEKQFISDYQTYVSNNKLINILQQKQWGNELQLKYQAQTSNQERGLGFYENYLNENVNNLKAQFAQALGQRWAMLMQPDQYGLAPGDVGSIYAVKTNTFNLNPSQGFPLYSMARQAFSQEIAVSPTIISQSDSGVATTAITRNWFNQKETMILSQNVQNVEIRFKAIYVLNSFHIGLYIGGSTINTDDVIKNKMAPVDADHLAKMIVFRKADKNSQTTAQVYEHEGVGWFNQPINSTAFALGTWYHIKISLNNTTLQVKVWAESDGEPGSWQSFTVSATDQKTIGVVSSGASIEYQILNPKPTIQPIVSLRPENKYLSPADQQTWLPLQFEKDRENAAQQQLQYLLNPTVGDFNLKPYDKMQIIKENYIYTTQDTKLFDKNNTIINDYVIPATIQYYVGTNNVENVTNIGQQPHKNSDIVSLVTNKVFTNNGTNAQFAVTNLLDVYQKDHALPDDLVTNLQTMQTAYQSMALSATFGIWQLKATSAQDIQNHHYIYTMPLYDQSGKLIANALDYVLFARWENNYIATAAGNPGYNYLDIAQDKTNQYVLISLVSGNVYSKTSKTPILGGFAVDNLLQNYQNTYGNLPADLVSKIQAAITLYNPPPSDKTTSSSGNVTGQAGSGSVQSPTTGSNSSGNTQPNGTPSGNSLQNRSDDANSDDVDFGF